MQDVSSEYSDDSNYLVPVFETIPQKRTRSSKLQWTSNPITPPVNKTVVVVLYGRYEPSSCLYVLFEEYLDQNVKIAESCTVGRTLNPDGTYYFNALFVVPRCLPYKHLIASTSIRIANSLSEPQLSEPKYIRTRVAKIKSLCTELIVK
jgi:hypothetical protein